MSGPNLAQSWFFRPAPLHHMRRRQEREVSSIDSSLQVRYREEAFSLLMLNAWELLLKARVIKENKNDPRSIEVWEPRTNKDGTKSKRFEAKRNRSGTVMTIGLQRTAALVREYKKDAIDDRCIENLNVLTEIRDTSAHHPPPYSPPDLWPFCV